MSAKWTDGVGATTGSRLNPCMAGSLQLSDGTLVCLDYDPDTSNLFLRYSSDHNSINAIDTVPFAVLGGFRAGLFDFATALCRDSSDNLYVVGQDHDNGGVPWWRVFAYTKGAGYTWTRTTLTGAGPTDITNFNGHAVRWCNTGGGTGSHGHLMVVSTSSFNSYGILDAGAALAGAGTLVVNKAASPAFLGTAVVNNASMVDLDSDGFGATSGIAAMGFNSHLVTVGAWGVSAAGALSTNTNITTALAGAGKLKVIRASSNLWAVCTLSTHFGIARFSSTAQLTATTDSGAPAGLPALALFTWDFALDPGVANQIWGFVASNISSTTVVKRLACDVTSGVSWSSTVITDDASMGTGGQTLDLRIVPTATATKVDYQVSTTQTGGDTALAGNWTTLRVKTGIYIGAVMIG